MSLSLAEVMMNLREEFSTDKWNRDTVRDILSRYDQNCGDWKQYERYDDHKYVRVLIDAGNEKYNLVILCWNVGQGTPVHDHPASECMFKVCDGAICETRFDFPEGNRDAELEVTGHIELSEGEVGHINDVQGIHRMDNESDIDTCVTLHCYFPPYLFVNVYDERTGTKSKYDV